MKAKYVSDILAGESVNEIFVLAEKNVAQKKDGNNYLTMVLGDRTGRIKGVVWDNVATMAAAATTGDFVEVGGSASEYRGNLQMVVRTMEQVPADKVDPADFLPATTRNVEAMFERGEWHQEQFPENPLLSKGVTQDYFPGFRAFLPGELRAILKEAGMRVLRCGGLGTLANFCGSEAIEQVCQDKALLQDFVDLCERFDLEVLPDGPGTKQRAGLIAVAVPE